jgi:hypothetical protein
MTVDVKKLEKMARQIIANMNYIDDPAIVAAKAADHMNRFWDPRMKAALRDHGAENSEEFEPLLQDVIHQLM